MSALLFDTLRLALTLRDRGHFTLDQAEALTEALVEAGDDDLATKTNVADLKAGILKRVAGAIGFQTAVIQGTNLGLARIFVK